MTINEPRKYGVAAYWAPKLVARRHGVNNLPTTYAEALERLGGRTNRTIANNTVLQWGFRSNTPSYDLRSVIELRLHGHPIVTFYATGEIELSDEGWQTVTTKQRLNVVARAHGLNIGQLNWAWYIEHLPYSDRTEPWQGSYTIPAPKAELIGTRCECGAPYDEALRRYACAR